MDEQIFSEFSKDFTASLEAYSRAPAPRQDFVSGLEGQLLAQQAALPRRSRPIPVSTLFTRRNWRATVFVLLIVLAAALLLIGPQRVLAQVQRWLGYVPGIGFVDLKETRVLVSPVEVEREGIRLRVEQVIAGPERTEVLLSGFSERDLPWPNEAVENEEFFVFLRLQDGSSLPATRAELSFSADTLEARLGFPALPEGSDRVSLVVRRLPLAFGGTLSEDWEIPLTLRSTTNEVNQELFPQPYSLPDARDSQHGITLRLLNVAQTSSETALQYQVEWEDPSWQFRFGFYSARALELRDDLGHIYLGGPQSYSSASIAALPLLETTPAVTVPNQTGTLVFPPLSLSAGRATLWVDSMEFWTPEQASFRLDLGISPKIGDSWPLDVHLNVAGFPVHLTEARLREQTVEVSDGKFEQHPVLHFSLEPLEEQDGFHLLNFGLVNEELGIYGSAGQSFSNGLEVYDGQAEFITGKLPGGIIELQIRDAALIVQGPWEVTWDIPGKDPAARPVRLSPKPVEHPDEIRPVVEEVFLSDRLTALRVGAIGLPKETSFLQTLTYDPSGGSSSFSLEDNWGRRYPLGVSQTILRTDDEALYDPRWHFFPPLQPLAQSLTLRVPAIELSLPARTSFEVEVPEGITFKPEEYEVTTVGGGGPARQETQTRWVSDPWAVDLRLEVAGYELQFTEAQVQQEISSDLPYLLFLRGKPITATRGDLHLSGLRFSRIEQPDGTVIEIEQDAMMSYPYGGVGRSEMGSNQLQAMIVLDVTGASRDDLLAGRYRVEIDGVTSWVLGPWELDIPLSGN